MAEAGSLGGPRRGSGKQTVHPEPAPPGLADLMQLATQGYHHAQSVIQSRLYNYLVAASILVRAWATLFNAAEGRARSVVLIVVAALGVALSLLWSLLGMRQAKFVALHLDICCSLENELPVACWSVAQPIADLRKGRKVTLRTKDEKDQERKELRLNWLEQQSASVRLTIIAPVALLIGFLFLLLVGAGVLG
jgi:hypothetical protein